MLQSLIWEAEIEKCLPYFGTAHSSPGLPTSLWRRSWSPAVGFASLVKHCKVQYRWHTSVSQSYHLYSVPVHAGFQNRWENQLKKFARFNSKIEICYGQFQMSKKMLRQIIWMFCEQVIKYLFNYYDEFWPYKIYFHHS